MILCTTAAEMQAACRNLRTGSQTLGLVPTMGALHAGHLSLVAAAHAECDFVAASIFVNPTQFGPSEDLDAYPRTFDEDCRQLEAAGVHLLFAPSAAEMYPNGNTTLIEPGPIATRLDGASRPGHFRGVATIVTRLFNIVAPDRAYFGQKDAAQVAVLRHIVRDLNLRVELRVCPIVREPGGLAMSSRNRFLSPAERARALVLHRALRAAEALASAGITNAEALRTAMLATFHNPCPIHDSSIVMSGLSQPKPNLDDPVHPIHDSTNVMGGISTSGARDPGCPIHDSLTVMGGIPTGDSEERSIRLDYAVIVHPDTLLPIADTAHGALLAIAAWIGNTRLIDNILLSPS